MTNTQNSKFMKFGDKIVLLGTTSNPNHGKVQGFLSGMGFSDTRMFFQKVPDEKVNQSMKQSFSLVRDKESVNSLHFVSNYSDLVFQVWPRLVFDAHKEFRKKKREKQKLSILMKNVSQGLQRAKSQGTVLNEVQQNLVQIYSNIIQDRIGYNQILPMQTMTDTLGLGTLQADPLSPHPNAPTSMEQMQTMMYSIENRLLQLEDLVKQERETNMKQLNLFTGDAVTYGLDLQLMHVNSKNFLNGRVIASQAEKSAYSFNLSQQFSGGMVFRFQPKYKLRQLGEGIQYTDMVILMNVKMNCYTNFSLDAPIDIDRPFEVKNKDFDSQPELRINNDKTPRYEAFLTLFSDTCWQVIRHGRGVSDTQDAQPVIRGGQIIRLIHTESGEPLTADVAYEGLLPEGFLRTYMGEFHTENLCVASLWQLELDIPYACGSHLHYANKGDGSPRYLRLRHLLTGRFMGMEEVKLGSKQCKSLVLMPNQDLVLGQQYDLSTRVILEPTIEGASVLVVSGQCYHMKVGNLYLRTMKDNGKHYHLKYKTAQYVKGFYRQLSDSELGVDRKALEFIPKKSYEDAFRIESISSEGEYQLAFILSTVPQLIRFVHVVRESQVKKLTPDYLRTFLHVLSTMIRFIQDKDEDTIRHQLQRQLKNCNFIDYLSMILYWLFQNQIIVHDQLNKAPRELVDVAKQCYKLIRAIIKEYRPNELYASQWIDLYLQQSVMNEKNFDIGAGQALTELLDNNRFVLEKKISKDTIDVFVTQLILTHDVKYLNLLRALINCDGQAMVGSQAYISKLVLKDMSKLVPEIKFDGFDVQIKVKYGDFVELQHLYTEEEYNYIIMLFYFLADLCLDKNYLAITPLQIMFPIAMCKFIVKETKYQSDIRGAMAELTLMLWIEGRQMTKLLLPNYVRNWDQVQKEPEILSQRSSTEGFGDFKILIFSHLTQELARKYQRAHLVAENRLTYVILRILMAMLTYGIYRDKSEIMQLILPLVGYLNGSNDVTSKEEEASKEAILTQDSGWVSKKSHKAAFDFKSRYKDNRLTSQLSKSRALICEIFHYMQLLSVDIRASVVLQLFKKDWEKSQAKTEEAEVGGLRGGLAKGFSAMGRLIPMSLKDLNPLRLFQEHKIMDPELVPLKWIGMALENKESTLLDLHRDKIVAVSLDLLMYHNVDLISQVFTLLNETYSHKISLLRYLKDIQIIEDANMHLLDEVVAIKQTIQMLSDGQEDWWSSPSKNFQEMMSRLNRLKEILNLPHNPNFQSQSQFIKIHDHSSVDENDTFIKKNEDMELRDSNTRSSSILHEVLNESIRPEFQKMMKNLELHKPLIAMLNFDLQLNHQNDQVAIALLHSIYQFLAYFCFQNDVNRDELQPSMKLFKQHFNRDLRVGSHLVIQEMVRNNRMVLMKKKKLKKFISRVCTTIEVLDEMDPLRIALLDSLKIFMRIDGRVYKPNQVIILSIMSSSKSVICLIDDSEKYFKYARVFSQQFEKATRDPKLNQELTIPVLLDYFLTQLQVMYTTAEEKNTGSESKCQAYFPVKRIVTILGSTRECWPLRMGLVRFYFHVFLEVEKELEDLDGEFGSLVQELLYDLNYLSQNYGWLVQTRVKVIDFQRVQEGKAIIKEYLLNVLVPTFLFIIRSKLLYPLKNLKALIKDIVTATFEFGVYQDRIINAAMCKILISIEQNKRLEQESNYQNELKPKLPTLYRKYTNKLKFLQPQHRTKHVISELGINEVLYDKLNRLSKHPHLNKEVESEIELLVNQIMNIQKLTKKELKRTSITWDQIMAKMVKLVDLRTEPRLSNHLVMVGLKVFRKIIEKGNPDASSPAADWNYQEYSKYEKKIMELQKKLINLGVIEVLCCTICLDLPDELKHEALLVASALLLNGNKDAQKAFYDYFQKDTGNVFIIKVHELMDQNFVTIKRYSDRKIREREHYIKYKDLNTIPDQEASDDELADLGQQDQLDSQKDQMSFQRDQKKTPQKLTAGNSDMYEQLAILNNSRTIRFLQLLCEGHHFRMQNYLRIQTQKGEKNGKTINLVQYVSLRFGTQIKSLCTENLPLLVRMVQLLIEMIQGPCFENQEMLILSKIVDICGEVIGMFDGSEPNEPKDDGAAALHTLLLSQVNNKINDFVRFFKKKEQKVVLMTIDQQRRGFIQESQLDLFYQLASNSSTLLLGLLEANSNENIATFVQENLELSYFRSKLTSLYKDFVVDVLELPYNTPLMQVNKRTQEIVAFYDGQICDGFKMYILIVTLAHTLKGDNLAQQFLMATDMTQVEVNAMEFYRQSLGRVEVFFIDRLVQVFFRIDPTCKNISTLTRRIFMEEVKRDSPNDKISGLIDVSPILFTEMHHMSYLKTLPFQFTATRLQAFRDLSTILALIINITLIFSFKRGISSNQTYIVEGIFIGMNSDTLILVLGMMQLVTSCLMLTFWVIINTPVILKRQWNYFVDKNRLEFDERIETNIHEVNRDPSKYTPEEIVYLFRTKGPYSAYFMRSEEMYLGCLYAKVLYNIKSLIFLCSDDSFIYMFFYIAISIIGVAQSPILYCFHLLDVINRFETLKSVVRSVTKNFRQLCLTFFLMCIICYIFTVIGYHFFNGAWWTTAIEDGFNQCQSLIQCYLNTVQFGLRNGGGIPDSGNMIVTDYHLEYRETFFVRFVYDIIFFALIPVIFLNIIQGIIIDCFAELRDKKNQVQEDMNSKCYVCSLDRYVLEKNANGFDEHIQNEHSVWNYLHYLHYLDNLNQTERNGIESHCIRMMDKGDITWFPIMKAMALRNKSEEDGIVLHKQLVDVTKELGTVNTKISNLFSKQ